MRGKRGGVKEKTMAIDIKGLDKVEVLRALYLGTTPLGLGILHDKPTGLTRGCTTAMPDRAHARG